MESCSHMRPRLQAFSVGTGSRELTRVFIPASSLPKPPQTTPDLSRVWAGTLLLHHCVRGAAEAATCSFVGPRLQPGSRGGQHPGCRIKKGLCSIPPQHPFLSRIQAGSCAARTPGPRALADDAHQRVTLEPTRMMLQAVKRVQRMLTMICLHLFTMC